jgi:hypothetical protein
VRDLRSLAAGRDRGATVHNPVRLRVFRIGFVTIENIIG